MEGLEGLKEGDKVVVVRNHGYPYLTTIVSTTKTTVVIKEGLRFYKSTGIEKTSFATAHIEALTDEWRGTLKRNSTFRKVAAVSLEDWRKVSDVHIQAILAMLKEDGIIP